MMVALLAAAAGMAGLSAAAAEDWKCYKKRWDALSGKEQTALQSSADETAAWITKTQDGDDAGAPEELVDKYGWTITPKSATVQAEIAEVMEPTVETWAEERGPVAVQMLADLRKALGRKT
jgi:TRAP-type C4-dicarboxylate transport system substrate-binding protein